MSPRLLAAYASLATRDRAVDEARIMLLAVVDGRHAARRPGGWEVWPVTVDEAARALVAALQAQVAAREAVDAVTTDDMAEAYSGPENAAWTED
jgi:hypothetical protein